MTVALPAHGRSISGHEARSMMEDSLPPLIMHCLTMNVARQHGM